MTGSVEAKRAAVYANFVLDLSSRHRLVAAVAGPPGARSGGHLAWRVWGGQQQARGDLRPNAFRSVGRHGGAFTTSCLPAASAVLPAGMVLAVMHSMARLDGLRILVVEDAGDIRDVMKRLLEMEGAEVVVTGTGREAVDLTRQSNFDVLLTDLGLPDIPGDVVIRNAKAHSPRLWIVVATAYDEPYIGHAKAAGADAVVTKPISWPALLDRLVPGRGVPHSAPGRRPLDGPPAAASNAP